MGELKQSTLERGADGSLTIHPDPRRLPKFGSLAALPFAVLGAIRLVLLGWVGVAILVGTVAVAVGLAFLIRRLLGFHSYARLTPSTLTVKPWYGRPRTLARAEVSRVVLTMARLGLGMGEPDVPLMLFLDTQGRCLRSLNCLGIPPADASTFAHALGVPVTERPDTMRPKDLRREYPGSVSAYYAHQVPIALGASLVMALLVIVGVVSWAALTGQFGPPKPVALGVPQSEVQQGSGHPFDKVTVARVDDPARAAIPASATEPGTHFVGVAIRVKNSGSTLITAPHYSMDVRDSRGTSCRVDAIDDPSGAKLNTDADVNPGATQAAYVLIRVPDGDVVTRVLFNSTGDENDTLTWIVPRRPPAPTPPPAALGQPYQLGDQQVAVLAVDPAAQGPTTTTVPPGDHLVGVQVRMVNRGSADVDPPYQNLSVVDSRGGRNDNVDVSASTGAAENPVKAGQTVTTTVYFDVPQGASVIEVDDQYDPAGVVGRSATVAWTVPSGPG